MSVWVSASGLTCRHFTAHNRLQARLTLTSRTSTPARPRRRNTPSRAQLRGGRRRLLRRTRPLLRRVSSAAVAAQKATATTPFTRTCAINGKRPSHGRKSAIAAGRGAGCSVKAAAAESASGFLGSPAFAPRGSADGTAPVSESDAIEAASERAAEGGSSLDISEWAE